MTMVWAGYGSRAGDLKTLGDCDCQGITSGMGDFTELEDWDSVSFSRLDQAHAYARNGEAVSVSKGWTEAASLYAAAQRTVDITTATDLVHKANYAADMARGGKLATGGPLGMNIGGIFTGYWWIAPLGVGIYLLAQKLGKKKSKRRRKRRR